MKKTKTAKRLSSPSATSGLFDPVETAILCHYFGLETDLPLTALGEGSDAGRGGGDPDEAPPDRDARAGVRLAGRDRLPEFGRGDLANGVARICLNAIQERLPDWVGQRPDGRVVHARKRHPRRKSRVDALPRHLFTINWASSGPGFDWPEAYWLTLVPGFDRYVVTKSGDTDEVDHGDLAIGWFDPSEDVREASLRIIGGWWRSWKGLGHEESWSGLWYEGLISREAAWALASEVWPGEEGEDPDVSEDPDEEEDETERAREER